MYKGVEICGIMKNKHSFGHNHQGDEKISRKSLSCEKLKKGLAISREIDYNVRRLIII
jgi:hypothetical protein